MEPVYAPVLRFAKALFASEGLKFTLPGIENIPRSGGGVVVMNHISYLDFAYAGVPYDKVDRIVRFMAKKEVFDHKVSGPLMRGMKHIPVDRTAGADAYKHAVDALQRGELIGVFPEATISRSFELKEFKTGAVRMAQEAGVPMLPTVLWGSQRIWTKDHKKRLGRTHIPITVAIGKPMQVAPTADPIETTAALKAVMAEMLDTAQRAYEPLTGDEAVYLPARLGGRAPTIQQAQVLEAKQAAERAAKRAAKTSRR